MSSWDDEPAEAKVLRAAVAVSQQMFCQMCTMLADPRTKVRELPKPTLMVDVTMPCEQCTMPEVNDYERETGKADPPGRFLLCRLHYDDLMSGHSCPHGIYMIVSEPISIPTEGGT
jgi:hypothetical protein